MVTAGTSCEKGRRDRSAAVLEDSSDYRTAHVLLNDGGLYASSAAAAFYSL
jgi:hypothetical protein